MADPGRVVARFGVLIYIDLWVLEGAFRKWVPGVATPFYFARDAVALLVILILIVLPKHDSRRVGWFWLAAIALAVYGAVQVFSGLITLPVMAVGLREYLAPLFPLLIVLLQPSSISFRAIAIRMLVYVPVQLGLALVQVSKPPASFWNAQANDEITKFVNSGVARATGTFSAPAGFRDYVVLCLALALALLIERSLSVRWAVPASIMLLLCTLLSGSRGAVLGVVIVLVVVAVVGFSRGNLQLGLVVVGIFALVGIAAVVLEARFGNVADAFITRFQDASMQEDTSGRLVNQAVGFLWSPTSLFGTGIGSTTQAGIALGSDISSTDLEAVRWSTELGVVGLGLALAVRLVGVVALVRAMIRVRVNPVRESLLLAFILPTLLIGASNITTTPSYQAASGLAFALWYLVSAERRNAEGASAEAEKPSYA